MDQTTNTQNRPFRAIVVGAGIAGLTLSNTLQRYGIEHVVLEKHKQIIHASGASIGIWPNGSHLLKQLGCLEWVEAACSPLTISYNRASDGKVLLTSKILDHVQKRHGYRLLLPTREDFLTVMYNSLPSQSCIRTGCVVTKIIESDEGVRAFLADGSYEDGDVVVGCDGVSSSVRQFMWDNANRAVPNTIPRSEKTSLQTRYKCLVGLSTAVEGIAPGTMTVIHNDGFSFLIFTQPQQTSFFVFEKLDKTYHWPSLQKYSTHDTESHAARLLSLPINEEFTFEAIWRRKIRAELVNIEEGLFHHWYAGRIVLVGDAAHKFTPNIALGGNAAMESAVALANVIHAKLLSSASGWLTHPTKEEISLLFKTYQSERTARVRRSFWLSTMMTRIHACENFIFNFIAKYCFPLLSDAMLAHLFSTVIGQEVALHCELGK